MKPIELLKVTAIALMTSGLMVGCQQSSTDDMPAEPTVAEDACEGATPEVRNAIYAAKLKNARARNLGAEWEENAKLIEEAEAAAADCENDRAKTLANKAEAAAAAAIKAMSMESTEMSTDDSSATMASQESPYIGGYLVVSGDNLWNIAGQDTIYSNPFMWPLIYKANSGQIKDADLIHPGQYFYIPKARGKDRAAAMEHARNRGAWTLGETEASDLDYLSQ
jgi:nucleoid-associated protein YgaU